MTFPRKAANACDQLYARYPQLAQGDDPARRKLTRMIVEQIARALGDRWGCKKRAGLDDEFQSKDAIAYREDDNTVSVWDWQDGTTRKRGVNEGDEPSDAHLSPEQAVFMPVTPADHLGWYNEEKPPPVDRETLDKLGPDVRAALGRIESGLQRMEAAFLTAVLELSKPQTAYVKIDLKPVATGGYTAYVKFSLRKPL